jgi:large subunit ribosomal protein L33
VLVTGPRPAGKRQPYRRRFRLRSLRARPFFAPYNPFIAMQETVTLECTEARKEGKPPSRYLTKRNKKTVTERIEKKKYNPFLKRHTLHKEIK